MKDRKALHLALALIAIICFLVVGYQYLGQLHKIKNVSVAGIAGIATLYLFTLWVQSLTIKWGLKSFGHSLAERESFTLTITSSYANLLLPRSGMGTMAVYLAKVRKCSMLDYGAVMLFNGVLFVLACSTVGCLGFGIDWFDRSVSPSWVIMAGLPMLLLLSVGAIAVPYDRLRTFSRFKVPFQSLLRKLDYATSRLTQSPQAVPMGLAHVFLVFLRALRLYLAFKIMGVEISPLAAGLASILGDLAFIVSITPSALGFREAAIAIVTTQFGLTVEETLSVAVLDRLVFSVTVFIAAQVMLLLAMQGSKTWQSGIETGN